MSDEGQALKYSIHLPCLDKGCNGSIIFIGLKNGIKYFKCCICQKEFSNRRKEER